MHARMTVAHAQPDRFEEAVAAVQEAFVPAAREQPGYRGFLLLTDRDRQQLVGISLWETEADAVAFGRNSMVQQVQAKLFPLFEATPTTEIYEVRADA